MLPNAAGAGRPVSLGLLTPNSCTYELTRRLRKVENGCSTSRFVRIATMLPSSALWVRRIAMRYTSFPLMLLLFRRDLVYGTVSFPAMVGLPMS